MRSRRGAHEARRARGARVTAARAALAAALLAVALLAAGCAAAAPLPTAVAGCPEGAVVGDAASLRDALAGARPGDVIVLAPGRYEGSFEAAVAGTEAQPITLCGAADSVLDGGGTDRGYTLHLDGADHWTVSGLAVTGGMKGVMLDRTSHATLSGLTVSGVGDEAIHLRSGSSDNVVEGNDVSHTGLRRAEFGEGVYVGTAQSNWCEISGCAPDASDRNRIVGNRIHDVTAEAIDVKEGTSSGEITGNVLDGAASTAVDSLIDVKGDGWTVSGNTGTASPGDGAQVHSVVDGTGRGNTFSANSFGVAADGYAVAVEAGGGIRASTTVSCDNVALVDGVPAPDRTSTIPCRP
jgi:parallel beta-helix repeat protein